jgi:prophage regulatory protein
MMTLGEFPTPVPIGARAVAWVEEEIDSWISQRIAARKASKWQPIAAA